MLHPPGATRAFLRWFKGNLPVPERRHRLPADGTSHRPNGRAHPTSFPFGRRSRVLPGRVLRAWNSANIANFASH